MVETNNLFEVSMGKVVDQYGNLDKAQSQYYTKALSFQNEMNEKLGTNRAELEKYQAMYYSMFKSQGINLDSSYLMSESLTKAGYDIASLYNLSVEDSMNKLKSGLAGQVESLRQIGIDVSESSLTKVLNEVGITDRSVQQLSYAEKEVARYIAIMEQASSAQGDFAKTIDSSANQLKIFKNQIAELKQVAGSFIVNTFGNILVYVNAVIMVLKEILKSFANLFGYDLDTGGADLSTSLGVDDLSNGLGTATKKAKELKKQLMGFDEINNIDPNSTTSGGSSKGVATGIDDKLLNSLREWDNKMSSISGKAQEIRDKMLDWLGFVRNDDGTWRLGEGLTNFEKILDVVKAVGIAFATWKVSSAITGLLKSLGILKGIQAFKIAFGLTLALTGIYLLYKGIKHLLDGNVDIFTILETALGGALTTFGIATILKGAVKTIELGKACKIGFGVTLALGGIYMEYRSVKKMLEGDISLGTILQGTGSAFLIGIGTALITGNPLIGLVATAGVLAFNLGIEIGIILRDIDWASAWEKVKDKTKDIGLNIARGIISGLTGGKSELLVAIVDVVKKIVDWFKEKLGIHSPSTVFIEIGHYMIEGLIKGIADLKGQVISKMSEIKDEMINKVKEMKTNVAETFFELKNDVSGKMTSMKQDINNKVTEIKENMANKFNATKESTLSTFSSIKSGIEERMNNTKNSVTSKANSMKYSFNNEVSEMKNLTVTKFSDIKQNMENKINEAKNSVIQKLSTLKDSSASKMSLMKQDMDNKVSSINTSMVNKFNSGKNTILNIFDNIHSGIGNKLNNARNTVANQISNIRSLFNFSWSLPNIKTPHFSWSSTRASGWIADTLSALNLPTSIPKLNVSWYAKGGMPDIC